ncbi:hypothetical protein EJ07DRAFT_184940 [Lizonia empirigonia]|nr:hypothetical protein EJ07DRAFT_184940 [Lizonia empirigonia]
MSNIDALIDVPHGAQICAERLCIRLPVAAIRRSGGTVQVLCLRHLSDDVRLKRRELARLDGLLNKIYLSERRWLQRFHTHDAGRLPTGTRVLFQRELGEPLTDQSMYPDKVPQHLVDVGHCFNGCVHILEVLAGVLAFFAEGSFEVKEVDIVHVKSDSSVLVIENIYDSNDHRVRHVCQRHSMLKLSCFIGNFYLDPTAPQYGRPQGLHGEDEYLRQYTSQQRCAAIRRMNNVVYDLVRRAGGPRILRTATDATWATLERTIMDGLHEEFKELRHDIDQPLYGRHEEQWHDVFEDPLQDDEMTSSRETSRDMHRLAILYNGVALVQLEVMHWEVLVDHYLRKDGPLKLRVQTCEKPVADVPLFGPDVSDSMKKTVCSVNNCVAAVEHNTVWLAYCVEALNFDIKEITFNNPKPARKVEMWLCTAGEDEQQIITDYGHTVLKFIPESKDEDAIVADATYAQYSFDHGIDTYDTYCATKVGNSNAQSIQEDILGCCFLDYETHDGNVLEQGRALAVIRTTDNFMHRELGAVGGVQALLEMSEEGFQRATDGILAAHCKERVLWRTLVRIGTIYNMLFMCRAMNMSLDKYLSSRMVEDKVREVIVDWPTVKAGERWYPDLMDPQAILGAVSFDQCRIAITLLSPVLAWLSEGLSVKIREIRFPPINKRCQVYNICPPDTDTRN